MAAPRRPQGDDSALRKIEELNVGELVVKGAVSVVKTRPVSVSVWVVGLLLAAFATGFSVDEAVLEQYSETMKHAEQVTSQELSKAHQRHEEARNRYNNVAGWFSCDAKCQRAKDQMNMAAQELQRVEQKRQQIMTDARREVGIWSVFGVRDVRERFWQAWKQGKDTAARMTMMDAFMLAMPGSREESMISMVLKLVVQYVVNLSMGLFFSMIYFVYNVYTLVVAYGESLFSGTAFFLLVVVASFATVGTYLLAICGTVAGGGLMLAKQAAKQAALEGERRQRRPEVGYRAGPGHAGPGHTYRSHYD